jgi:hypothetical protein
MESKSKADETTAKKIPIRDKCRHYFLNSLSGDEDFSSRDLKAYERLLPGDASHGDMIIIGEKSLRSLNVYFLSYELNNQNLTRKLVQKDLSGSGYSCVPIEVTKMLQDPLKFYDNAFHFGDYDEIDFSGIEIDTQVHQNLIKQFTNGKAVSSNRKCFYFLSYNEWDSSRGKHQFSLNSISLERF